jgi:hypothetical protein
MVVLQRFRRDFLGHQDNVPAKKSRNLILFYEAANACGSRGRRSTRPPPGLGMRGADTAAAVGCDQSWESDDIESVLNEVDQSIVEALTEIIPGYNPALREGRLNDRACLALRRLDAGGAMAAPYRSYLEREGCMGGPGR